MEPKTLVHGTGGRLAALLVAAGLVLAASAARAGDLNPPAGPTDAGSAMYTIEDLYNRLSSGSAGTKRTGAFTEPSSIGATYHTLDQVMGAAPALSASGAVDAEVCSAKTYWGLKSGSWGPRTGSGACPPVFLSAVGPFTVAENAASGAVVGTVTASGTGVAYTIQAGNTGGVFAIGSSSGQITRSGSGTIDYETARSYSLTVRATIGATTRDVTVTVDVTNVDDNNPAFVVPPGPFSVAADAVEGTTVGWLAARDADGDALTYAIAAGNGAGIFAIAAGTGQITRSNSGTITFETTKSYTLTVEASDGSGTKATASVSIAVTGANQAPTVATNTGTSVTKSTNKTIDETLLSISDPDSTKAQRILTVTQVPTLGSLQVNIGGGTWVTLVAKRSFFTQVDLEGNDVRYAADGTSGSDAFKFTVSDSEGGTVTETTFAVTVTD